MGLSYTMLNEILNAKRPVTETIALCFESALGIEAEMLVNMQSRYNMQSARQTANCSPDCKTAAKRPLCYDTSWPLKHSFNNQKPSGNI